MSVGEKCPNCNKQTFHDKGSHRECSSCGCVGWSWQHPVKKVGKGKGNKCHNCGNQTLHVIAELEDSSNAPVFVVRRCGVCDFSSIHPTT
jgi:hypothetical protein